MHITRPAVVLLILAHLIVSPALAATVQYSVNVAVVANAPSDLTAFASSPSQVLLSWTDNSNNESGFAVERKSGTGTFSLLATTTADIATYTDNNVAANTSYSYRVAAFIDSVYSPYSNEATTTTPSTPQPPAPSGGGGGGSMNPSQLPTSVIIRGMAYPGSDITILKDAAVATLAKADSNARFEATLSGLSGGNYAFSIWAQDISGLKSVAYSFIVVVVPGATTIISGIFLPPTIFSDKISVKQGDRITFFGYSVPSAQVTLLTNSDEEIVTPVNVDASGYWVVSLDTKKIELGKHSSRAKAQKDSSITTFSDTVTFDVGSENKSRVPVKTCPAKGDFNGDCRVNLVDFSILAYWYKRVNPPIKYDLNRDGKISLPDFSILAFYWTG